MLKPAKDTDRSSAEFRMSACSVSFSRVFLVFARRASITATTLNLILVVFVVSSQLRRFVILSRIDDSTFGATSRIRRLRCASFDGGKFVA